MTRRLVELAALLLAATSPACLHAHGAHDHAHAHETHAHPAAAGTTHSHDGHSHDGHSHDGHSHAVHPHGTHSHSSLQLVADGSALRADWHVLVSELDAGLRLDADGDGEVEWEEMRGRRAEIEAHLLGNVAVRANGAAASLRFVELVYGARQGTPFLLARLAATAPQAIRTLELRYALFPPGDAGAHADLRIVWAGAGTHEATVTPRSGTLAFARDAAQGSFARFLREGVRHIWTGFDHVLFLLVLLVPTVFRRTAAGREPVDGLREAVVRTAVVVTAFTAAHSLTLAAAALGWVSLPGRIVEPAIAASVFVAALLNLLPQVAGSRGAWVAFAFCLLHGFGFADVLGELDRAGAPLWSSLLAFNLGVELGQLAIVAVFLPIAYALRRTRVYRAGVLYGGSTAAAACAAAWFWARVS
ncbi:MAG: HupE/UreJ family protein [Pseudomonadota bacterium]